MPQRITSAKTSVNQVASTFNRVQLPRGINLDYGGGRFDRASETLADRGILNFVYDPFNRTPAHNLAVRASVFLSGGADSATVNNVLNVIDDDDSLLEVVRQAANSVKPGGIVHFLVYEGDSSGIARETPMGWQRNAKPASYAPFLDAYFSGVSRKGNLFSCSGAIRTSHGNMFSRESIVADAMSMAKSLGVPIPPRGRVGKHIGGAVYVHSSASDAIPAEALALSRFLPDGFSWDVAKYDAKSGSVSFISAPGFMTEDEPLVGDACKVFPDGRTTITKAKSDPQIYHHKWSFMRDDGSDMWLESLVRSVLWSSLPDVDKSRIGTLSHWVSNVSGPFLGEGCRPPPRHCGRRPSV